MLRQVSGPKAVGITLVTALLAVPSLGLVATALFSSIHFDGNSLFLGKAVLTALLLAAIGLLWWSAGRLESGLRRVQLGISALHVAAFALLAYWFTGISHFFR